MRPASGDGSRTDADTHGPAHADSRPAPGDPCLGGGASQRAGGPGGGGLRRGRASGGQHHQPRYRL